MKNENMRYLIISTFALYLAPSLIFVAGVILSTVFQMLAFVLILVGIAAFPFLFGRSLASSYKIHTPQSLALTYFPAFIPALVVPVLCLFTALFDLSNPFFYMPNWWSWIHYIDSIEVYSWGEIREDYRFYSIAYIYLPQIGFDLLYGLLYVFGIRFGERGQNAKHDKLQIKYIVIFAVYFAVSIAAIILYSNHIGNGFVPY